MRQELFMARRKRRKFSREFKAEAVRLTRLGDRTIEQVGKDLDLTDSALRRWVQELAPEAKPPEEVGDAVTLAEKAELAELRREVKKLRQERDILKAAATFFAKESE
jgi:transposase-like protein